MVNEERDNIEKLNQEVDRNNYYTNLKEKQMILILVNILVLLI